MEYVLHHVHGQLPARKPLLQRLARRGGFR